MTIPQIEGDRKHRILIIGDIMIDHYIHGNCNRISPEAPVPIVEVVKESYTLGGAGNVVKNVIALGAVPSIISIIGNDDNGKVVIDELSVLQVPVNGISYDQSRCTTTKSRILATNHQLIRLDREDVRPIDKVIEQTVLKQVEKSVGDHDLVLISDYNKGLLTSGLLKEIFQICNDQNIKTIVDPKGTDFSKYNGVNIMKPNKKEASIATGIAITDEDALRVACQRIKALTGCQNVIITMSEEGIALYDKEELSIIPTEAQSVIDVTGAGDTVLAALGIAIVSGASLREACRFANHAAAIVISKVGSATVTMEEINRKFYNNPISE
jgi:rfaE bifunctional protein kinase chain/domain